jgi:DNA-directed RNA polymerase specialized sigma24 family protein
MPNQRYRMLIQHRYVDGRSNEETASLMSMTMPNYYNKHKLAKAQFVAALRKEGLV